MTESDGGRRRPTDSFRVRLAIVRTEMGWNYDQAEAATGVGSESWRTWEKGTRHCSDVIGVSHRIAAVTPYDVNWLVFGGAMEAEVVVPSPRPRRTPRSAAARSGRVAADTQKAARRNSHRYSDDLVAA